MRFLNPELIVVEFRTTFHAKGFCSFYNIETTLQQNHAGKINKKFNLRGPFLNL